MRRITLQAGHEAWALLSGRQEAGTAPAIVREDLQLTSKSGFSSEVSHADAFGLPEMPQVALLAWCGWPSWPCLRGMAGWGCETLSPMFRTVQYN